MSQELTVQNEDGFDVQEPSSNYIIGGMIKYAAHVYTLNKTEELVAGLTLLVKSIITCWVRWRDHAPTEHRVTRSGQMHPRREDLPDQDQKLWQPGLDGNSADPWKDSRYMHLIDLQTGRDYTFVTDTAGGRMAIGELKSSIRNVRMARPGAMPIIKFGTTTFKNKKGGLVPRPLFETVDPVDWPRGLKEVPAQITDQSKPPTTATQLDMFAKPADKPAQQTTAQTELPLNEVKEPSLAEEMNDEVPDFGNEKDSAKAAPPPAAENDKAKASQPRPTARRDLKKQSPQTSARAASKKRLSNLDAG